MKKLLFLSFALAGCMMAGCSSDDDGNNNGNNSEVAGTYRMTAFNAPSAQDYDDDGDSSVNLMTESNCFNNTTMTLNEDGTFTSTYNAVGITGGVSSCAASVNSSGTWTRSGNTISTTTTTGGTGTNSWTWNSGNTTLSRTQANAQYPTFDSTTGTYSYMSGNVGYTYKAQQ